MPRRPYSLVVNVAPNQRGRILDSDIEKIYGRVLPEIELRGRETFTFYMATLSEIHIVSRSFTNIKIEESKLKSKLID